jgi:hypothetical protein
LSRDAIIACINHSKKGKERKQLLTFCTDPKSWNDIKNCGIKGDIFSMLRELKICGALTSESGQYCATELALSLL